MAHRFEPQDVERALERYRELTGDRPAKLRAERAGSVVAYRVDNSVHLRGFMAYGAFSAVTALEMYCNGYEDRGRLSEPPKKPQR